MTKTQIDEKKSASASYIISFYQIVQLLNVHFAQYKNMLIEIKAVSGEKAEYGSFTELQKEELKKMAQIVRQSVFMCNVQYRAIVETVDKLKIDDKIKDTYKNVCDQFVISVDELESYVIGINKFLLNDIIGSLLETSQALLNSIFDNSTTNK